MELPLSVFYGSMIFFLALPIVGYVLRMQLPISAFMFASGLLMISLLLAVDSLLVQEDPEQRITTYTTGESGGTIIENKPSFDFSLEGENYQLKVFWILIAVLLIVGGVVIEVRFK